MPTAKTPTASRAKLDLQPGRLTCVVAPTPRNVAGTGRCARLRRGPRRTTPARSSGAAAATTSRRLRRRGAGLANHRTVPPGSATPVRAPLHQPGVSSCRVAAYYPICDPRERSLRDLHPGCPVPIRRPDRRGRSCDLRGLGGLGTAGVFTTRIARARRPANPELSWGCAAPPWPAAPLDRAEAPSATLMPGHASPASTPRACPPASPTTTAPRWALPDRCASEARASSAPETQTASRTAARPRAARPAASRATRCAPPRASPTTPARMCAPETRTAPAISTARTASPMTPATHLTAAATRIWIVPRACTATTATRTPPITASEAAPASRAPTAIRGSRCLMFGTFGFCSAYCSAGDAGLEYPCDPGDFCDPSDLCRPRCDDGNACAGADVICDTGNAAKQNGQTVNGPSGQGHPGATSCLDASDCGVGHGCPAQSRAAGAAPRARTAPRGQSASTAASARRRARAARARTARSVTPTASLATARMSVSSASARRTVRTGRVATTRATPAAAAWDRTPRADPTIVRPTRFAPTTGRPSAPPFPSLPRELGRSSLLSRQRADLRGLSGAHSEPQVLLRLPPGFRLRRLRHERAVQPRPQADVHLCVGELSPTDYRQKPASVQLPLQQT